MPRRGDNGPSGPSSGPSSGDSSESRFTFVFDKKQSGTHNHAMREYWRKRRRTKQESRRVPPTQRRLLPNVESSSDQPIVQEHHPIVESSEESSVSSQEPNPGIPTQFLTGLNHALASTRLDPFNTFPVTLTSEHHKLMHHWLTVHAAMMFEDMPTLNFNPMRDVWLPLDLSNAASFNVMMAHSAAHLAYFYGGTGPSTQTNSYEALRFKADAVLILNQWLMDPEMALSNDAFAAVVRLLTFERYWGTEDEWNIHRNGLQRMIEARGGLDRLHGDWRLEHVVGLISLMARPSWFESANGIWEISEYPASSTMSGTHMDVHKIRSLWLISFVQDIRTLMSLASYILMNGLSSMPSLHKALLLIRTDFVQEQLVQEGNHSASRYCRLASLIAISVVLRESVSSTCATERSPTPSQNRLAILDESLETSQHSWEASTHNLLDSLYNHFQHFYADGAAKIQYIMQTTNVLGQLSLEAQRGIEKCLINMLCRSQGARMACALEDGWTPDSLMSSLHGQ